MKPLRTRFQLYLPDDIARQVDSLARQPGTRKSAILDHAVRSWFGAREREGVDDRLATRLIRIGRAQESIEQGLDRLSVMLETFALYHLTLTGDHPPFDVEAAQRGRDLHRKFIEAVDGKLAQRAASRTVDGGRTADGK